MVQYLVTPIEASGASAATQLAQAVAHLPAMRLAVGLDVLLLLTVPAVLYVGAVAGARTSRLAAGAALSFVTSLSAGYLLDVDVLVYEAASRSDQGAATLLIDAYQNSGVVTVLVLAYLAGHVVGMIMWRSLSGGPRLCRSRQLSPWGCLRWPRSPAASSASRRSSWSATCSWCSVSGRVPWHGSERRIRAAT